MIIVIVIVIIIIVIIVIIIVMMMIIIIVIFRTPGETPWIHIKTLGVSHVQNLAQARAC